ncbi:MAG: inosine/xanthosine triphosphatase [Gammaproteobacteria bacterium]|nr:inosine/xanthosine triphosphatase [Gammaproteobacteria bacterium]
MKIVVASKNPVKVQAVEAAFRARFPQTALDITSVNVESGVSDQPMSDQETRRGAHNRVDNARERIPDADFWVGLEGGLETIDGEMMASAWMVIGAEDGRRGEARTPTLPLPPQVLQLVRDGLELGEANDQVFSTLNSKQGGGAFGLLTDGLYTRGGVYTQTLVLALVPLTNPLWAPGSA